MIRSVPTSDSIGQPRSRFTASVKATAVAARALHQASAVFCSVRAKLVMASRPTRKLTKTATA